MMEGVPDRAGVHTRHGVSGLSISAAVRAPERRAKARSQRSGGRGDRSVRGSVTTGTAGAIRPRSSPRNEVRGFVACVDPPKRASWREPRSSLVKRSSPQELEGPHPAKAGIGSQDRARCGCTWIAWVAEVDRTHLVPRPPARRKARWGCGELARRKHAAGTDARRAQRDGEKGARGCAAFRTTFRSHHRSAGFGSRVLDETEGAPGWLTGLALTSRSHRYPWFVGQVGRCEPRKRRPAAVADRAVKDTGSGVPTGDRRSVRDRTGTVKALQVSQKRRGGSASSALKRRWSSGAPSRASVEADVSE